LGKLELPVGKGFKEYTYVDEALNKFLSYIKEGSTGEELIPVSQSIFRVLAEDIVAKVNVPPFPRAAMDGFAVLSDDIIGASPESPITLKIVGESAPGKPYKGKINRGEAVKISTGAPLPEGADVVVPYEYTSYIRELVEIKSAFGSGQNVSKIGEDVKEGETLFKKGTILEPFDVSLLQSIGVKNVRVYKRHKVGILATGSELKQPEEYDYEKDSDRYIVETNRTMIKGMIIQNWGTPIDYGIVGDDENEIKNALKKALDECDMVVLSGGSSVGEYDLVPKMINDLGKPGVIVHGVTAHPGRPVALAIVNEKPVINIPGYPVAAYIDFLLFGVPALYKLQGIRGRSIPRKVKAILKAKIPSRPGTRTYARVKLLKEGDKLYAMPIRVTGAGVLSSLSRGDGFVVVYEDLEGYDKGDEVDVLLYRVFIDV